MVFVKDFFEILSDTQLSELGANYICLDAEGVVVDKFFKLQSRKIQITM